MDFYLGELNDIRINKNDHLYVIIDNDYKFNITRKNIVIPFDCIFSYNGEDEITYYNNVASKMKTAGFNGFMNWVIECNNNFSNYTYHDDNDRPVIYKAIVLLSNNDIVKHYIETIFTHFGFAINKYCVKIEYFVSA